MITVLLHIDVCVYTHPSFLGGLSFPDNSVGKESICNAGDLGSIPGLGRSPEEGKGSPLQYSGLENSMDYIVHGVTKSRTRLSDFHFTLLSWWLSGKESACSVGDLGSIPELGRSPGEGKDYPLQNSGLENSMDCIAYWVAKSQA